MKPFNLWLMKFKRLLQKWIFRGRDLFVWVLRAMGPNDSEIIFAFKYPLQSVVEPHHDLEEQQANLEDKAMILVVLR